MITTDLRLNPMMENGCGSSDSTPLADLMIILLAVQLMLAHVACAFLPGEIALPESSAGTEAQQTEEREIVIAFSSEGQILWNDEPIGDLSDLKVLAEDELASGTPFRFLLAGDRAAPYGLSMEVKAALWEAGVTEVDEMMERR